MKKKNLIAIVFLAALLTVAAMVPAFSVKADTPPVDPLAPFLSNVNNPGASTVKLNADGSYSVVQTVENGSRLYYGEHNVGVSNPVTFGLNLTDFTMDFSVEEIKHGAVLDICFVSQYDDYPVSPWGQGIDIRMCDDAYDPAYNSFNPYICTFSTDNGNHPDVQATATTPWHVYENISPRTSYQGQKQRLHIYVDEQNSKLCIDISWLNPTSNSVNYSGFFNLSDLPTSYGRSIDLTNVGLMFTPRGISSDEPVKFTIYSIQDAYYDGVGGKTNGLLSVFYNYDQAIKNFNTTAVTKQMVVDFYKAKDVFDNFSKPIRLCDQYYKEQVQALSTEGFAEAAVQAAETVFSGYTTTTVLSTPEEIEEGKALLSFYTANEASLETYSEIVANIFSQVASDPVAEELNSDMATFVSEYSGDAVTKANYLTAKAGLSALVERYNALSSIGKALCTNYEGLNTWSNTELAQMKELYYSTDGTYFTNNYTYGGSEEERTVVKGYVGAEKTESGTKLIISDAVTSRVVYGDKLNVATGLVNDYAINIKDFKVSFTIDDTQNSNRFAFNFGTSRTIYPWGNETNPGITVLFRTNFTSGNGVNIALKNCSDAALFPRSEYPNIANNDWGGVGDLLINGGSDSVIGKLITIEFKGNEEGTVLSVSIEGGNKVEVTIPQAMLDTIFGTGEEAFDTTKLVWTITMGEGATVMNGGKDMVLTIKNIDDEYSKMLSQLSTDFNTFLSLLDTLSAKQSLTIIEIGSFNSSFKALADAAKLVRGVDGQLVTTMENQIDPAKLSAVNDLAKAYITQEFNKINITLDTIDEAKEQIAKVKADGSVLTEEQMPAGAAELLAAIEAKVPKYEAIKTLIADIATFVQTTMLPTNVDSLRTQKTALQERYDAVDADLKELVSNYESFTQFVARLDAYNPVQSVIDAINQLDTDYATITAANKQAAKQAAQDVKDSYAELTDEQKEEVTNYSNIATFEAKIAAFEEYQANYAIAVAFDSSVEEALERFETLTANTLDACKQAVTTLKADYADLTEAQKALATKYDSIQTLEDRIAAFEAKQASDARVAAVVDEIEALSESYATITEENKQAAQTAIQNAKDAYQALSAEEKEAVTNYSDIQAAEDRIAAFEAQQASDAKVANVVAKINAIGEVTVNSKSKIDEATEACNALTAEEKAKVTNYSTLEAAAARYAELTTPAKEEPKEENPEKKGCKSSIGSMVFILPLVLVSLVALVVIKRRERTI